ncbi:MAG: hypothetical protein ACLFUF_07665 [Opitutales bacterium]
MEQSLPNNPEAFLVCCLSYCMTWELAGPRAPEHWADLRAYAASEGCLGEGERWAAELYEEGPPSAQEERSILARIESFLTGPCDVDRVRNAVLNLLPEELRTAAKGHSLLSGLKASGGYGKFKAWATPRRFFRKRASDVEPAPQANREAEFSRFLEFPHAIHAFRRFWRVDPKKRDNRRTRVLVCLGAALSQMLPFDEAGDLETWMDRFAEICAVTEQTKHDLLSLVREMQSFSYDAHELAYYLLVDARGIDKRNLLRFIQEHKDRLSDFAGELEDYLNINELQSFGPAG